MERKKSPSDLELFLNGLKYSFLTMSLVSASLVAPYVIHEIAKPIIQNVSRCLVDYHDTYSKITIPMN